jgi:hypothetical protein
MDARIKSGMTTEGAVSASEKRAKMPNRRRDDALMFVGSTASFT